LRYARNYFTVPDDLIDFTPELRTEAVERAKKYVWASTPFNPSILGNVNGMLGAITVGTATNWPGGGYDRLHITQREHGQHQDAHNLRRFSTSGKCQISVVSVRESRPGVTAPPMRRLPPARTWGEGDASPSREAPVPPACC
jgi:hypothetical protein